MLKNKKILFFSPSFFNYEHVIKDKMMEMGADVYFFDERPFRSSYQKVLLKIQPNLFSKKTEAHFDSILHQVNEIDFDYVFFIKCEMPTEKVLKKYRLHFKKAKFCLYMWDSIANVKNIQSKFKYFDVISSFDKHDCEKNAFHFRPLFYSDQYAYPQLSDSFVYDISSFGTIHSDRYRVILAVEKFSKEHHLKTYFFNFLQAKFMYYFYKLSKREFAHAKITDFSFDKKSSKEITDIILTSKVVLDIQHPRQTGLTMRTIEMIGMNKKIITTNSEIVDYDFYNPNNIYVIDRNNIQIDVEFFNRPYKEIDAEIYKKYSLGTWVIESLGVGKNVK